VNRAREGQKAFGRVGASRRGPSMGKKPKRCGEMDLDIKEKTSGGGRGKEKTNRHFKGGGGGGGGGGKAKRRSREKSLNSPRGTLNRQPVKTFQGLGEGREKYSIKRH